MALVCVKNLRVGNRLNSVSFELQSGEMLGLIGPNGAGKSTLLNAVAGIEPSEGEIRINGSSLETISSKQRAQIIGLHPQSIDSVWSISVNDVIELGRLPWGDKNSAAIDAAIEKTNLHGFTQRRVNELSGGERARVWLARVLAGTPQILLADEPIANLDIHYQLAVMDVLRDYAMEGRGVIVAVHDLGIAARYCHRLCLMKEGHVFAVGTPAEVLDPELLAEVYQINVRVNLDHDPPIVLPRDTQIAGNFRQDREERIEGN